MSLCPQGKLHVTVTTVRLCRSEMLQIGSNFDTIRKRITYFKTDAEDAANCVGIYPFLRVLRDFQDFQDLLALMDHQ